ncbi:DUF134 domain-containing protein [Clostridiaceae bacterium HSG29]|nr:DUF134 domain-containing protein [Clostridiaceae bacterium HSG29]
MVRPRKLRRIGYKPEFDEYTPSKDRCIELTFEELESIRLIDYEKLNQQEASELMNVGRTTLQAIYKAAREKVSVALIENISISYLDNDCYEFYQRHGHGRGTGKGRMQGQGQGRGRNRKKE